MNKLKFLIPILSLLLVFNSCDKDEEPPVYETQTIVDLVTATSDLSSLQSALQRADLISVLDGVGPFTVLAPSNTAFESFLSDNGFSTVDDIPVDVLTQVLLNHVIAGNLQSTDLSTGFAATSATSAANGSPMSIYINTSNGL